MPLPQADQLPADLVTAPGLIWQSIIYNATSFLKTNGGAPFHLSWMSFTPALDPSFAQFTQAKQAEQETSELPQPEAAARRDKASASAGGNGSSSGSSSSSDSSNSSSSGTGGNTFTVQERRQYLQSAMADFKAHKRAWPVLPLQVGRKYLLLRNFDPMSGVCAMAVCTLRHIIYQEGAGTQPVLPTASLDEACEMQPQQPGLILSVDSVDMQGLGHEFPSVLHDEKNCIFVSATAQPRTFKSAMGFTRTVFEYQLPVIPLDSTTLHSTLGLTVPGVVLYPDTHFAPPMNYVGGTRVKSFFQLFLHSPFKPGQLSKSSPGMDRLLQEDLRLQALGRVTHQQFLKRWQSPEYQAAFTELNAFLTGAALPQWPLFQGAGMVI